MKLTQTSSTSPWYKEPWFFLAFTPAALGVVFGLTILTIGLNTFDGTVHEDYYKEGRAINQSFDRDRHARELNLLASLQFAQDQLHMDLSGQLSVFPDQLVVLMENPTRAAMDFEIPLQHLRGGRYVGNLPQSFANEWDIKIYGPEREWRIYGRGSFPRETPVVLSPSRR